MTIPALTQQPRLADAKPLALIHTGAGSASVGRMTGVSLDAAESVGEQILSARIELPPGEWILWPERGWGLWVGARAEALPNPVRRLLAEGTAEDLIELVDGLAAVGVWCRDAALLTDDGWSRPHRADAVLAMLSARAATALSGVFVDRSGRTARLEIASGRVCWTDRPALAIQWLLTVVELPLPT